MYLDCNLLNKEIHEKNLYKRVNSRLTFTAIEYFTMWRKLARCMENV